MTCTELNVAVDAARAVGALGARMTGGGFGGSAIALADAGPHPPSNRPPRLPSSTAAERVP